MFKKKYIRGVFLREQTTEVVNKNFELDYLLSRTSSCDRHLSPTFILVAYRVATNI